jgi:flagellin
MTRINTNVSSLTAQQNLQKSNSQLQTALTRLSTGLRINSGKDDPAGMIAAAQLGSEISSTNVAVSNSKSAEQMIDTADTALGQVTSLLNDIRSLITQAANDAAMSTDQINANQLQIDSSLAAINRISQTTTYQGRNLLDGTLGYTYTQGANFANVTDLDITQATLGTADTMTVTSKVTTAAQQAHLETVVPSGGVESAATYTYSMRNAAGNTGTFTLTAPGVGTTYNNATLKFATSSDALAATPTVAYNPTSKTLTITVNDTAATTYNAIETAVNGSGTGWTMAHAAGASIGFDPTIDSTTAGGTAATGQLNFASGGAISLTAVADAVTGDYSTAGNMNVVFNKVVDGNVGFIDVDNTTTPGSVVVTLHTNAARTTTWTSAVVAAAISHAAGANATGGTNTGAAAFTATATSTGVLNAGADNGAATSATTAAATTLLLDPSGQQIVFNAIDSGYAGNDIQVVVTKSAGTGTDSTATWGGAGGNTLTLHIDSTQTFDTYNDLLTLINGAGSAKATASVATPAMAYSRAASASTNIFDTAGQVITFTDDNTGTTFNDGVINLTVVAGAGADTFVWTGHTLDISLHQTGATYTDFDSLLTAINGAATNPGVTATVANGGAAYTIANATSGTANMTGGRASAQATTGTVTFAGGQNAMQAINTASTGGKNGYPITTHTDGVDPAGLTNAVTFRLSGALGANVFNFGAHTTAASIMDAVNQLSDSTGVVASLDVASTPGTTYLVFSSSAYGTDANVSIDTLSGSWDHSITTRDHTTVATSDAGTDVVGTINGITANGNGNTLSVNTGTLGMSMSIQPNVTGNIIFTITGGGALFQLGANINTNNQASIGVQSVDTGSLGGVYGKLYQLASGKDASLTEDKTLAANITDEALNKITSLRGRLGAFEKTSLETNINTLSDTVVALTNAQSQIQDADFAAETANLTRAQILVQSGTAVLQIANRSPQNVLSLLQQ